ncbi:MAG: ATP-binding cassette domain-containing protein, partial [Pseudomonadota bacterium]
MGIRALCPTESLDFAASGPKPIRDWFAFRGDERLTDETTTDSVLRLRDFRLRFRGQAAAVVDGVNLSVRRGEVLCIVGESGCGKSVTAMALMGLLPDGAAELDGHLDFDGLSLDLGRARLPADRRGGAMAMIFQEPMSSLNPAFRIGDQIAETVRRHRGGTASEARDRA